MAFTFRIRAPERDRAADEIRFEQVIDVINKTRADIARESRGLRERCEKARCSASFALEAIEGDERDPSLNRRIRELSDTILACEARLATLERQVQFFAQQEETIVNFAVDQLADINQPSAT
jgi:hypothetical protein